MRPYSQVTDVTQKVVLLTSIKCYAKSYRIV